MDSIHHFIQVCILNHFKTIRNRLVSLFPGDFLRNNFKNFILFIFWEVNWIYFRVQSLNTKWNKIFRCSLNINSANLIIIAVSAHNSLHLQFLIERKLADLLLKFVLDDEALVNVFLILHQEINHSNLNGLTLWYVLGRTLFLFDLKAHVRVRQDSLPEQ